MSKHTVLKSFLCISLPLALFATNASDADTLQGAIKDANDATSTTITFTTSITLNSAMDNPYTAMTTITNLLPLGMDGGFTPVMGSAITINGGGNTLNGTTSPATRGFFVRGGSIQITNLNFDGCTAKGGRSLTGGSGGGLGGSLFVDDGTTVTLTNCTFSNSTAEGGDTEITGSLSRGGGGFTSDARGTGGGGLYGDSASAGGGGAAFDSPTMSFAGGNSFDNTGGGADGVNGGPGGGGGRAGNGGPGGGGGSGNSGNGANGGDYGGGGADDAATTGGRGGFAGGGGFAAAGNGGDGGFAGGGGRTDTGTPGQGGFGGGDGEMGPFGGGGAGFGGAIFVRQGGSVTFSGTLSFSTSSAQGGTGGGGNNGLGLGNEIFAMSETDLTFKLSHDFAMPSAIAGNQGKIDANTPDSDTTMGGLTKQGTNRLTLVGDNTYTGTTMVEVGELRLNGSVVSNVEVDAGATFSGNSIIKIDASGLNGGNLSNSGRVEPGNDGVGTINLEGTYTQTGTGTFAVDITPNGQSDVISMNTQDANLDGDLEVFLGTGNYITGTTYTIITGDTNTTTFKNIIKVGPDADFVDIVVNYSSVTIQILNDRIFQDQNVTDGAAKSVAMCMEMTPITPGSDFALLVEYLGTLSDNNVNQALREYSPAIFGAFEIVSLRNSRSIVNLLEDHMIELCCSKRRDCCHPNELWLAGFGNFFRNKRFDEVERFHSDAAGLAIGFDRRFCEGIIGFAGGYTTTDLDFKETDSQGSAKSVWGAVYGSHQGDSLSMDGSLIVGTQDQNLGRRFNFTNIPRKARSHPDGQFVNLHFGMQGRLCACSFELNPFVVVDYHVFNRRPFQESGAKSANLDVLCAVQSFIRPEVGFLGSYECTFGTHCFLPYFGIGWVGEIPLHPSKQKGTFEDQNCFVSVISYCKNNHLFAPQLGFKWTNCAGFSFVAGYEGLFNKKTTANQFDARLEWIF